MPQLANVIAQTLAGRRASWPAPSEREPGEASRANELGADQADWFVDVEQCCKCAPHERIISGRLATNAAKPPVRRPTCSRAPHTPGLSLARLVASLPRCLAASLPLDLAGRCSAGPLRRKRAKAINFFTRSIVRNDSLLFRFCVSVYGSR